MYLVWTENWSHWLYSSMNRDHTTFGGKYFYDLFWKSKVKNGKSIMNMNILVIKI